jgi:hypothetical protein
MTVRSNVTNQQEIKNKVSNRGNEEEILAESSQVDNEPPIVSFYN